jgi:hypothetical protein
MARYFKAGVCDGVYRCDWVAVMKPRSAGGHRKRRSKKSVRLKYTSVAFENESPGNICYLI